eukprot:scaffold17429_cov22-Tisochrysis_lutea.AAC.1
MVDILSKACVCTARQMKVKECVGCGQTRSAAEQIPEMVRKRGCTGQIITVKGLIVSARGVASYYLATKAREDD